MNIFVLDRSPMVAAKMMCDKHIPKMVVESAQMMASALIRHGATADIMPLTKKGTPYKGGYKNHPCTLWVGDSRMNFIWLTRHALALCKEYNKRFDKIHACYEPIMHMQKHYHLIDDSPLTPFALAMPDEYRPRTWTTKTTQEPIMRSCGDTAVQAYRDYYHSKTFAKWEKGTPTPNWWKKEELI